ncbi:sodium/calcium exchanger protein [Aspergillus lucknowensis]|uniref:Sodium/calcium exchanger protein-domain-containing protein n=1 Tax=Aspergillus lucknowensis TaxID=176173 RepID=A0ABR4LRJ3_9EURO
MFEKLTAMLPRASARRKRQYSARPFYLSLIIFTALAVLSWGLEIGRGASHPPGRSNPSVHLLMKRENKPECRLVRNANDKCAFARANCLDHEDGFFSYLQFYYCTLGDAKPLAFTIIVLWLSLLFSTIGIAASDFLCIDLSTLASFLGLSESLTGVTFLAFGNGSPDVFSTFAAMRSNSGSLAIGELIGAAGFITSVVAGSMALVRPFKVARRSFVRDVGYFVIAISFSMFLLADGHLHVWEAATMVALYCFYVVLVVTWHWYIVRRRRDQERNMAARSHFHIPDNQELDIEEVEEEDPGVASESTSLLRGATVEDFNALESAEMPAWKDADEDDETRNRHLAEIRDNMRIYRPSARRRNTLNPIRPSLVGALEFQSVLSSLQRSRSHHRNHSISLERYSDVPSSAREHRLHADNISIASHPQSGRTNDFLSPDYGTNRARAVSANDATGLQLDTGLFPADDTTQPRLTVSRPSVDGRSIMSPLHTTGPNGDTELTASPLSSTYSSRSPSPSPNPGSSLENSALLAPSDTFHSPNYSDAALQLRSPLQVSPRGTQYPPGSQDNVSSPTTPFPPFQDRSRSPSPGPPTSVRLPAPPNPTERFLFHESAFDRNTRRMTPVSWWLRSRSRLQPIISTLFPTLDGWKGKTVWEKLLGIVAAPSVFLLTISLPVVDPVPPESMPDTVPVIVTSIDDSMSPTPIVRLPEDSPILQAQSAESITGDTTPGHNNKTHSERDRRRYDSELPAVQEPIGPSAQSTREWCLWLVYIQLFVGPQFVALIGWSAIDPDLQGRSFLLLSLCALLFSLISLAALLISIRQSHGDGAGRQPPSSWRPILAFLGFIVAIFWVATIATEVVNLLKTLGVILNISDSLLGLTVFAVGNSLGDLVANITVARLGYPVMALSACFGGPMLNILLGIGVGGLYMTLHAKTSQTMATADITYDITVSKVLIISGATLLATLVGLLIVIPWNKWRMDRKVGFGLIILWCVSTLGNVIAEIVS